jgi:hypothetical protein
MLIKFVCNNPDCQNEISKFFKSHKDIPPFLDCGACGVGKMERQFDAPSTKSVVMVDNGVQGRAVEVMDAVIEKEQNKIKR